MTFFSVQTNTCSFSDFQFLASLEFVRTGLLIPWWNVPRSFLIEKNPLSAAPEWFFFSFFLSFHKYLWILLKHSNFLHIICVNIVPVQATMGSDTETPPHACRWSMNWRCPIWGIWDKASKKQPRPGEHLFQSSQYNEVAWVLNYGRKSMFDSRLCSQPQKHEFPQPPTSHLNPFCSTLFKYKIGLIFLPLCTLQRCWEAWEIMYMKTVPERVDHPGPVTRTWPMKCSPGFPDLINTWLLANLPVHWLHRALLIVSREPHRRKKLIDRIPFPREPPGWPSERTSEERHPSGFCVG